ncbi:MAG: endonuclease MutS2, partial [Lewinella sp.]
MQLLPADTLQKLEFDKVLTLLERHCNGDMGREAALALVPSVKVREINTWLDEVTEFRQGTEEKNMFAVTAYDDISEELKALRVEGYALVESGLAKINVLLLQAKQLFSFFQSNPRQQAFPSLYGVVSQVDYVAELSAAIESVIDAEGNIRTDASEDLSRIRRLLGSKQREVEKAFRSVIEKYRRAGYLSDTVESFRNGRRVLAVPCEHKRQIRGII